MLDQTLCTINARLSLIPLPRDIWVTRVQNMQISFAKKNIVNNIDHDIYKYAGSQGILTSLSYKQHIRTIGKVDGESKFSEQRFCDFCYLWASLNKLTSFNESGFWPTSSCHTVQ